ncbi:MAG: magnesium transporter, partial [Gemmiger sp.]|nr:magnesium transporter [Gemmiger sp.]
MSDTAIQTLKNMLAHLDDAKKYQSLRDVMSTLNAPDLAAVFEDLPPEKMPVLFRLMPKDLAAEVFAELTTDTQEALIYGLSDRELKSVIDELFVDDATDLVEEMPAGVVKRILGQADPDTRKMINELLKYPEDSAGGVMTTEFMELTPDMTIRQALESIRANGFDKETINNCYVTQRDRTLSGVVSLRALILAKDENQKVTELMETNVISVSTGTDREQTSQLFSKYGFLAIPVVDNEGRLVGIVTIDDAIAILQDEASEDIAKMSGVALVDKPYFKRSMLDLFKSRAPWLLFLMVSATFSSLVIRSYEDALAAVTVLTAYIPMLTDTGGNAGSQSTSTIIRGIAVGEIHTRDLPRILWREFRVSILCGGTLALCNFAKLLLFDQVGAMVAAVVCLTLIITVIISQLLGASLPVLANKIGIDPAVMASLLITTI